MTPSHRLSGSTAVCAVVGDPVRHSLSPRIHNAWMAAAGLDAVYVALHLQSSNPEQDLASLWRSGLHGLNVTVPHKMAALASAVERGPVAARLGAANTLVRSGAGWIAHNTDVDGFAWSLHQILADGVSGRTILVLGAGGSARAVVDVLGQSGARLIVVNRTQANAETLCAELAPKAKVAPWSEHRTDAEAADLVVDTTSAGHSGEAPLDLPPGAGRPFLSLSYGQAAAPALSTAGRAGWTIHDGLPMLVGQAAAAFRLWFGGTPDMTSALADCRAYLQVRA